MQSYTWAASANSLHSSKDISSESAWPDGRTAHILIVCIVLLTIILRLALALRTHFTQEDSLITLRYAAKIAGAHGFVYNLGQRVLGTTTPLYTLILAAAIHCGFPALAFGKLANILCDGALCWVVYRLLCFCGLSLAGLVAAIAIAINPIEMRVSISGQESCIVALLGAQTWLKYVERKNTAAYLWGALLFLFRWDGLLLIAAMTAAITVRDRKVPWIPICALVVVCAPWLIFAAIYFGSPVPVTLAAKTVVYGWYFRKIALPELWPLLSRCTGSPWYACVAVCALVGIWRVIKEQAYDLLPLIVWFAFYWIAFIVSKVVLFEWYFVPTLFVYIMFSSIGLATLIELLRPSMPRPVLPLLFTALFVPLAAISYRSTVNYTLSLQRLEDRLRLPIGIWLKQNAAPGDTVMLEPIGYIGYYSQLNVLDMTGLVTPSVLQYYKRTDDCPWLRIAYAYKPQWCVLRPGEVVPLTAESTKIGRPWDQQYQLVKSFYYSSPGKPPIDYYDVFHRRNVNLSDSP